MSGISSAAFKWDLWISMLQLAFGRLFPSLKIPSQDLNGKVAIVTGSNSGIGLQVALELAKQGARVYLACRSESKAKQAVNEITAAAPATNGRVHTLALDTSSLSSVRQCAKTWEAIDSRIDILFHNAGRGDATESKYSADGLPLIYATNFLGSFLLTFLLEKYLSSDARVILTSSTGQYSGKFSNYFAIDPVKNKLERGFHSPPQSEPSKVAPSEEYSNSKAMQCAFAKLLSQHWTRQAKESGRDCKRVSHSFTPGFTYTPIFSKFDSEGPSFDVLFWILKMTYSSAATPVQQGALTGVWLASSNDDEVVGNRNRGAYWDRLTPRISKTDLLSQDVLDRMWIRWAADAGIDWR